MQLMKFTHSCVRITDGDRQLVIDPGAFSEVAEALAGVDAVLITHEHFDHVDIPRLAAAADANPQLRVWAPAAVAAQLAREPGLADRTTPVGPGEQLQVAGFEVRTFGGQHALIHPSVPTIANVAYLIDDAVYHPGDSYVVPPASVELGLIPLHAPWAKVAETMDYAISLRPRRAMGIHDALLAPPGLSLYRDRVAEAGADFGTEFLRPEPGEVVVL